jgi:hypothetical protein
VDLPGTTKHVAAFAAYFADARTGTRVRPGRDRLAREAGLSVKAVGKHLAVLEDVGLLWRVSRGSGGGDVRIAAEYRLSVPRDVLAFLEAAAEDDVVPCPARANRNLVPFSSSGKREPEGSKEEPEGGKREPRSPYLSKISSTPSASRRQSDAPATAAGWGNGWEGHPRFESEDPQPAGATGWGTGA